MRSSKYNVGRVLLFAVLLVVFAVIPILGWAATVWTDLLWFEDLGQPGVFWTRIVSSIALFAAFAAATFVIVFGNLRIARGDAPKGGSVVSLPDSIPEPMRLWIEDIRAMANPWLDRLIPWVALAVALSSGSVRAGSWQMYRLALARVPFGYSDPQFGRDVGFYIFTLPVLRDVLDWVSGVLVITLILSLIVHLLDGALQPWRRLRGFAPHVKGHLSLLAALWVASRAFGYWIHICDLVYSPRGQVVGASYTDIHAQMPAWWALLGISVLAAAALLVNIRYRGWKLPAIALGTWIVAAVLLAGVWPALMQQFIVRPNEARYEAPYIERNIKMTRKAFELTDVESSAFPASENLTAEAVKEDSETIDNVRLWDPDIIKQANSQLQGIRSYYDFRDVDVDRYEVAGETRQVLVSAREIDSTLLAETAQTWVNRHLVYTHGFGLAMSSVSEADSRGLPRYLIGDIPPKVASSVASSSPALETKQPRIYFGEDTRDYVIVNAAIDEFDYPLGDKNATYKYAADSGVEVGGVIRRLAWALRLGSSQVLFSNYVKSDSRVLLNRDLTTRLSKLAPWLRYEDDPYPVLIEGRIVWVIDAYTHSNRFPNAQGLADGTNYLRNSVKVTVDAFTGETTFYAFDEKDPLLKAWREVYPDLIADKSEIPDELLAHLRYPQNYFAAQAEIYRTYHMTDASVFYNKEDQWELPGERKGTAMEPFFVLLQLPGTDKAQFYLMQPYTPRNRDNMIGWMAVSCDPEDYGTRTVYQFPKERVILGPEQVAARINQDPVISPQLSLWNQRGSRAIFGNMLVIPIGDSIVYIRPLFLQAESTAIPELTRVVVVYADKVEMERTLEAALLKVFGEAAPEPSTDTSGSPGAPDGEGQPDVDAVISDAQRLYDEAVAAQKKGDWATYGERLEELGAVLAELAGDETTSTP